MRLRKALSAFLAFTILLSSLLFSYPLGISAEGENRVTAQTDATVTQGSYGYCYVYIEDASKLASLNVAVYYDSDKIEITDSYNQIACSVYDSSKTAECIQYTYLFEDEGSSSKTTLFYFCYRVKDSAEVGGTFFDIVINEAYDSSLQVLPVSGSRCNFTIAAKNIVSSCYIYGTNSSYSSINNEFVVHYMLSTYAIAAGSALIQYDSDLFEVSEVMPGSFFDKKTVDVNTNLTGAIFVSFSGTEYSSSSQFLSVEFKTVKNVAAQSAIKMTVIELYDLNRNKIVCPAMETNVSVSFDPSYTGDAPAMFVNAQYVDPGKVIATILLEEDSHLGAGDFKLLFDTSVLEYEASTKLLETDFFNINDKNVAAGELKFSIISLSDITDAANVLIVVFNVKHNCKESTTNLQISGSSVSDSLTEPITLNFKGISASIPAADTYGDWQTGVPATCESIGVETRICTVCNNVEFREIPALGHDMKPVEQTDPTCTTPGTTAGEKCSRCEHTTCLQVPILNHDISKVPAKPATCTEIGWNEYDKCSRCDYSTYVEIPALTHDISKVPAKPATCTEIGWNEYDKCSRCDYSTYVEIPALTHDISKVPAKPATCTEIGWNAYEKCSRCSYTTYVELPMSEHTYSSVVVKPQFGSQGYTQYTCSVCGHSYKDNYTDPLTYLPGDIDGSGAVDALDAETILKYITGHDVKVVAAALDVNGDGKVSIVDAITILLYLSGKIVEFN